MNSKEIQNIEPNHQQLITSFTTSSNNIENLPIPQGPILTDKNAHITQTIQETKTIIQSKNGIREIKETNYEMNTVPFKSLMQNGEDIIVETEPAFSSKHLTKENNLFNNNTSYNPFIKNSNQNSKKIASKSIITETNKQLADNTNNNLSNNNKIEKYFQRRLKSQDTNNLINSSKIDKKFFGGSVFRIKTYKSQGKQKHRLTTFNDFFQNNTLELGKIVEVNENYKLLIKRIAFQLKRKVKPPTQGFFYKYIKNEEYKLLVKRIAFQLKIRRKTPTQGFFYKYIKNVQYKLLVRRIAFQLKKRIKFPTCKIFKVYESYRNLIKRIAYQLIQSRKKRLGYKTVIKKTIIEERVVDNANNNNNNIMLNNNQINNINIDNNNLNVTNTSNGNINQNISSIKEINKTGIFQNPSNQLSNDNNNKSEKMDIDEEGIHIPSEEYNQESSLHNTIKISESNFSFGQGSEKNKEELNKENNVISKKFESIEKKSNEQNSQNNHNSPVLENKIEQVTNNVNKIVNEGNIVKSYPASSKKKRKININLTMFKKEGRGDDENILKLSEEKNIQNKTYKKEVKRINEINMYDMNINHDNEQDLNVSQDLNASLSNIEVTKSNFIHDFKNFLNKANIQIVNNFPVSLKEKNKHYFQQSNFWLLIINYLFLQDKTISLYTIISLLEQYFLWCKDINLDNFTAIKERIKKYIDSNFFQEEISQFLFMNQLKSIDDIFQKYEICIKNNNTNYKEIKINNINLPQNEIKCNCELCTNDNACIKKVIDINKNKIDVINDINIDFLGKNEMLTKYDQKLNIISNNEEISYNNNPKKNIIFSKSKTIYTGNNLEYNIINQKQDLTKNDSMEEINEIDDEPKNKTYKNISKTKRRKKNKENEKNETENDNKEEKEEKEEKVNKKEKEDKEEKEESDSDNKKKTKKVKKAKSRSRDKKKRDSSKSEKEETKNDEKEESIKNEEEEKEEKEERSISNKKKKDKKKNKIDKNKNDSEEKNDKEDSNDKDEEERKEERSRSKSKKKKKNKKKNKSDKEKNDSEEKDDKEESNDKDEEEDLSNITNSKRKKSKTPNKKKGKK